MWLHVRAAFAAIARVQIPVLHWPAKLAIYPDHKQGRVRQWVLKNKLRRKSVRHALRNRKHVQRMRWSSMVSLPRRRGRRRRGQREDPRPLHYQIQERRGTAVNNSSFEVNAERHSSILSVHPTFLIKLACTLLLLSSDTFCLMPCSAVKTEFLSDYVYFLRKLKL